MSYHNNNPFLESLTCNESTGNNTILVSVLITGFVLATGSALYYYSQHQSALAQIKQLQAKGGGDQPATEA
jgi:uncharacterized protein HemX